MSNSRRVLVIGLDGASFDLADQWITEGKLPVLADLMRRGGGGKLRSVLPVLSPAAWSSFATGVNPGKHGIFDFTQRMPGSYRRSLVTTKDLRSPTLWRLLSDAGKRVAVINVPITWPPEQVNGVMISGLGTPERQTFTYPPELGEQLRNRGYRVNKTVFFRPGGEAAFLKDTYAMTQSIANTAKDLLGQEPWDFFMVVFRDSDEMANFFWKHMDASHPAHDPRADSAYANALMAFYQYLDRLIGELVKTAGQDVDVIIMSDHGAGPLYKDVFLNEWLRQQGWLTTDARLAAGAASVLTRLGLTRNNISRLLQGVGLASLERALRSALGERIKILPAHNRAVFPDAIDWQRTRAYSIGYHGQIYLNVRGREPLGIVDPGQEYDALRTQIEDALRSWIDPEDGRPVVSDVVVREKAFHGAHVEAAPDLIVLMRDLAYITRQGYEFSSQQGKIFGRPSDNDSGSHRLDGLFFFAGPDFDAHGKIAGCSILDLAPTILHLLGLPVAEHMDGKLLSEFLVPSMRQSTQAIYASAAKTLDNPDLSKEEEEEIEERLRNLGYLG